MICPNCNTECRESDGFCYCCGAPLRIPHSSQKGKHTIPILILIGLSVLGIILFFAIPMTTPTNDTPWFTVQQGVLYFDESLYTGSSELVVPESIQGQTVTDLSLGCFKDCTTLTTVILPDTIEIIGESAFSGCTSLRGIFIPEGVVYIGAGAFYGCTSLEAITIPATVTFIGGRCFENCEKLYYILYNGEFTAWEALYNQHINIKTHIYCTDGPHLHR